MDATTPAAAAAAAAWAAAAAGTPNVLLRVCLRVAAAAHTAPGAAPLRFTLAWADPAPLPAAAKQLVKDLDLWVIDGGSGAAWAPNGGTGRDGVNAVERVLLGGRAQPLGTAVQVDSINTRVDSAFGFSA